MILHPAHPGGPCRTALPAYLRIAVSKRMPIKIPSDLPAWKTLREEGVDIIGVEEASRQDIRPLRIAILNLMPKKIETETQLSRLIGATPLQVEMTLLSPSTYIPSNTPQEHMLAFYQPFDTVQEERYDGLIITGAPVEELPFEEVKYWDELRRILDWSHTNVHSTLNICWGGQAALYHNHGVPKHLLPGKLSGIYPHRVARRTSPFVRGFNDTLPVPVSRYTENRAKDIEKHGALDILLESDEAGVCLVSDSRFNALYMFNHLEYDTRTLYNEYVRDLEARPNTVKVPEYYFPMNDPAKTPANSWRAHGHLLMGNWINRIYQTTPFELEDIGEDR